MEQPWYKTMDGGPSNPNFKEELYFSSPVWFEQCLDYLELVDKISDRHIKAEKKRRAKEVKENKDRNLTYQSGGLERVEELKGFVEYIGQRAWDFLDYQGYDLSKQSLIFTDLWAQEFAKNGGGYQDTHTHGNCHVTGFYFVSSSNQTSKAILHDPRSGAMMTKLPLKKPEDITNGNSTIIFNTVPGTLMLFNSYLPHSFSLDLGKEKFKFIHFNLRAVPQGVMGHV